MSPTNSYLMTNIQGSLNCLLPISPCHVLSSCQPSTWTPDSKVLSACTFVCRLLWCLPFCLSYSLSAYLSVIHQRCAVSSTIEHLPTLCQFSLFGAWLWLIWLTVWLTGKNNLKYHYKIKCWTVFYGLSV